MRYLLLFLVFTTSLFSQTNNIECENIIQTYVIDSQSNQKIPNAMFTVTSKMGETNTYFSDSQGNLSFTIPCDDNRYLIKTIIENYSTATKLLFTSKNRTINQEVKLITYPVNEFITNNGKKSIILDSIEFLPNETKISKEIAAQLEEVLFLMDKYPDLKIEIGFHTDSRGDESFLLGLTQKRAHICTSYLTKKGIESSRIVAKGYGASKLLNECKKGVSCSEKKHKQNRRSEFVVIP